MKVHVVLLALFASAAAEVALDPRGARPVIPNTRSEKCATQKEWPFCTDDEWGSKCPSGCRIQGLMEKYDHGFLKKVEKIRSLLEQNQAKYRSTDHVSKQTYTYLRDKLQVDSGNDNNYYDMAQTLRQRIINMKIKIDEQLQVLAVLKGQVKDQVEEMLKLEVDIDMKLRSCKGSCKTYNAYQIDVEGHVALEKQLNQLDTLSSQKIETPGTLNVMKSRPLKEDTVETHFKSGELVTAQQKTEDLFPEVETMQLFLEVEGSSSSPATISKAPVCLRLNQNGRHLLSHSDRKQRHCGGESNLPMCTDDDWVSRCPSGCRIQGLILENEKTVENKLRTICKKAKTYDDAAEKTMATTARIYHENRESITNASVSQVKFVGGAEDLAKNLTSLRKRSKRLELEMKELRGKVQEQLDELLRTEVEVDMRLRSCLGSCRSAPQFPLNLEDYDTLRSRTEKLDQPARKSKTAKPGNVPQIRTAPVDFGPEPSPVYKNIRTVLTEGLDLFEDLRPDRIILEEISSELD